MPPPPPRRPLGNSQLPLARFLRSTRDTVAKSNSLPRVGDLCGGGGMTVMGKSLPHFGRCACPP